MAEKAVKKKPNFLVRAVRAVGRFFRDTRGEMKKVVWPSRKQVWNNFWVVAVFVTVLALFIFGLDYVFNWVLNLILNLTATAA